MNNCGLLGWNYVTSTPAKVGISDYLKQQLRPKKRLLFNTSRLTPRCEVVCSGSRQDFRGVKKAEKTNESLDDFRYNFLGLFGVLVAFGEMCLLFY